MALALHATSDALQDLLGGRFRSGTPKDSWVSLRAPDRAEATDVAVMGERLSLAVRANCRAGLRIVGPNDPTENALEVEDPDRALATLVRWLDAREPLAEEWWSAEEVLDRLGPGARGSMVHRSCSLSPGIRVGSGVVLHAKVRVGAGCVLGDHAVVGSPGFGFTAEPSGILAPLPHRAGVVLEEDVWVGPLTNIAAGLLEPTWIGAHSRLDAHVQVGHNAQVGRGCVLAGQVGLAGSVVLGDGCLVGGQAGFADHVTLGRFCRVAGQSGVTKSWPDRTILVGFPARPRRGGGRDRGHAVLP
ncbi:MAG: hypothetical protein H6686_05740 [Fibrobacteria bacterium]|nr:hypothetical protein [Fibrobacteria bacterium]